MYKMARDGFFRIHVIFVPLNFLFIETFEIALAYVPANASAINTIIKYNLICAVLVAPRANDGCRLRPIKPVH